MADARRADPRPAAARFLWLTPERGCYVGLLGAPATRTMGCLSLYLAHEGQLRISLDGSPWQRTRLAVVPPHVPHRIEAEARMIQLLQLEPEAIDAAALPAPWRARGAVEAPAFAARLHERLREIGARGGAVQPPAEDFDRFFFGAPLPRRSLDARVAAVVEAIQRDPAQPLAAGEGARRVGLSFSRFLHLFKQEVGVPYRNFRRWKRARALLQHVNREANLAHLALDAGYPDSTHFSHSIRQVYGLKPRDIFAGSRRLVIYGAAARA